MRILREIYLKKGHNCKTHTLNKETTRGFWATILTLNGLEEESIIEKIKRF